MDPSLKERRRALELINLISRRTPLSPAQQERLERASRVLRSDRDQGTKNGKRRFFSAVGVIAKVALEVIEELKERSRGPK